MLVKILVDKKNTLSWEIEEKLLQLTNGFEVEKKDIVFWVANDLEPVVKILKEANISFQTFEVSNNNT